MRGIVGYTSRSQAVEYLLEGLKAPEYRGYDSVGVNLAGATGIVHASWATHGALADKNAHPRRVARMRGRDVDKPRNLAKSATVE